MEREAVSGCAVCEQSYVDSLKYQHGQLGAWKLKNIWIFAPESGRC